MDTEKSNIENDNIQPDDIQYDYKKAIEQIPSYALLLYIIIAIGFMILAFLRPYFDKTATPNNSDKMIRLFNFFWLIPIKINIILSVILALIKLFKVLFGVIFVKLEDKKIPLFFSYFLNYGIAVCLIVYILKPESWKVIFASYLILGSLFVVVDAILGLFGISLSYKKKNEMLFPYKLNKKIEDMIQSFQQNDDNNKMSPIEGLFMGIIFAIYIFFFLLFIGCILLSIIPLSYFIVFIYTIKIPTSTIVNSFKERRKAILLDRQCNDRPPLANFKRDPNLWVI